MKNSFAYSFLLLAGALAWGCKKDNYPGGRISPYIAVLDVRDLYQGQDLALSKEKMFGSSTITGVVVSDHSGGNLPAGLLVVQDRSRLSQLRGLSIALGAKAAVYAPGDSVVINLEGGVLTRADGILQVKNLSEGAVQKVSSGNAIPLNRVPSSQIAADPGKYESTLVVVVKGGFNPLPAPADVLGGDKRINDGFGELALRTDSKAAFAGNPVPVSANFYGIVFNTEGADGKLVPQLRMRTSNDVSVLSATVEIAPLVITGFLSDPENKTGESEGNYEYIQLMATRDIDFAATPFSLVTTNNAGASTPTGVPAKGWATGGLRSYKINLNTGSAARGTYFYVGGTGKRINGAASSDISSANWVRAYDYTAAAGEGFGTKTSNLLANSGNASGIAVFAGTEVSSDSRPLDVIFIGTGGTLVSDDGLTQGYSITNTDFYDVRNPITLAEQPFYRSGANTLAFGYGTSNLGLFNQLGGEYNVALGKWTKARTQTLIDLSDKSVIGEIEGPGATQLK
ncbi:DUF5689 domain-containing protein [Paraflavisolibacter sp. H34]|uniref:DUF5689 domain-containing protein n=1 Tax=Huijunlia imazamoxiresistens TaxID=3127457 RepID=UPI00301AB019